MPRDTAEAAVGHSTDDTDRFQCPDCGETYDMHRGIDGKQGCCPACEKSVRDRVIRNDPDQTTLLDSLRTESDRDE